ncbi:MAG: riboflavin biosynthesis protein RibF [Clostridia bacterium]|nr:riboflavin biosynthesis protein RibF [Clostridia bacterium]
MKIFNFGDNLKERTVLLLGYFDGLHKGHLELVKKAKEVAKVKNASVTLFTFDDNFPVLVKGDKCIFTTSEKLSIYEKYGVNNVLIAKPDKEFLSLSKTDFLNAILSKYEIDCVIFGEDYTFGYKGEGKADFLCEYLENKGVEHYKIDAVYMYGSKVSSSLIKEYLEFGKMKEVSALLGYDYCVEGEVIHGVHIGNKMGFPTLNTAFPINKKILRRGVYKTYTEIDGKIYNSITNFGTQPTFDRYNFVIETYVLNFNQDVYGKTVKVYFTEFIRGLIKFNSMEDLIVQIKEDLKIYD